jgi:hypothetical protein
MRMKTRFDGRLRLGHEFEMSRAHTALQDVAEKSRLSGL